MLGAILGSSIIGGISANKSAQVQKSAADQQAEAARYASDQSNATQRYIFDQQVKLTEPQRQVGNNALAGMASTFGLGKAPEGFGGFTADPGYQFRLNQGQNAMERMASARGLRLGSATLKAAGDYNQGMASQEYGNWYNRLAGLAGVGQTATQQQLNAGTNYANAFGQNTMNAGQAIGQAAYNGGQARASGYMGMNDAMQGGINNYFSYQGMKAAGMM